MLISTIPALVALLCEHFFSSFRISERHHAHHDTYLVPPLFTRGVALCMVLFALLGDMIGVMCLMRVFSADPTVCLAFFDAAVITMWVLWATLCRYKVSIFEANEEHGRRVVITPLIGLPKVVRVDDITHMSWFGMRKNSGYRDLLFWENGKRLAHIWAIVDLEQILLHIDRFDAFPQSGDEVPGTF